MLLLGRPRVRRILLSFVALVAWSCSCLPSRGWTQSNPPPWPDISLTACPKLAPAGQRTWKHGQAEQNDFEAAREIKDLKDAAVAFGKFAEKYPDSDYRDVALVNQYALLKDEREQIRVSTLIVESPTAEAVTRVLGFMALCSLLAHYVLPNDPEKERKLADLDKWTRCGYEALGAEVKPAKMTETLFQEKRQYEQSIFDRTAGFVALTRQNYALADSKLETARRLNSQDALAYLWLAETKLLSPTPDLNSGIFYLARATELAPQVPQMADLLKQLYVLAHGSEKGLAEVRTLAKANTAPPSNFSIQPPKPKKEHHYGTAIAATAIIGLLAYEVIKHPWIGQGIASGFSGGPVTLLKVMIFGGPSHRTYLGCLSCPQHATDSVFNSFGHYGSRYSSDSIWNAYGEFGSRVSDYSACNPNATDPPVIVDESGNAYGRLTVNRYSTQIGAGAHFYNWLASAVCHR